MKYSVIIIICFSIFALNAGTFAFGIIYPISTNAAKTDSVNLSLSLIQNSVGNVKGANVSGFSAVSKGNVTGFQSSLLYSQIDGKLSGVSMAGVNVINGYAKGLQTGFMNLLGDSFKGMQFSSTVNFVIGDFKGYQQSTLFNMVGGKFSGLQTAGLCCIAGDNFKGVQSGAVFNFTGKEFRGWQLSGVNVAGKQKGFQLGYINITQHNEGLQVGLLNIAEKQEGIPIGIINLSDDGNVSWQSTFSNFTAFTTGMHFKSGNFHSSIEAGAGNIEPELEESVILGFHYGYGIPLKKFEAIFDLGYMQVFTQSEEDEEKFENSHATQIRAYTQYDLTRKISLFAGFGITAFNTISDFDVFNGKTLCFAGINLF